MKLEILRSLDDEIRNNPSGWPSSSVTMVMNFMTRRHCADKALISPSHTGNHQDSAFNNKATTTGLITHSFLLLTVPSMHC